MQPQHVPWDDIDAFFIGGTTEWKLGNAAALLAHAARLKGKLVHMGRVNSLKRLRLAEAMGCHSADGTFGAFAPDQDIPRIRRWVEELRRQPPLPLGVVV